jgi:predicted transport protein
LIIENPASKPTCAGLKQKKHSVEMYISWKKGFNFRTTSIKKKARMAQLFMNILTKKHGRYDKVYIKDKELNSFVFF